MKYSLLHRLASSTNNRSFPDKDDKTRNKGKNGNGGNNDGNTGSSSNSSLKSRADLIRATVSQNTGSVDNGKNTQKQWKRRNHGK